MGFSGFCLGVGLRELGGVVGCGLVLGQDRRREGELGRVVGWLKGRRDEGRESWVGLWAGFRARGAEGGRVG